MIDLSGAESRLLTALNIAFLIIQSAFAVAYTAMVLSQNHYQQISASLYPNSEYLMNSWVAEMLVSFPALLLVIALILTSLFKELLVKTRLVKIALNIILISVIGALFGLATYHLYLPVQS